jgi:phytoene synthase
VQAIIDLASTLPRTGMKLWNRLRERSNSNFKFAFLFLSAEQRSALEHVYEFCRVVDDIVDERPPGEEGERRAREGLEEWMQEVARIYADAYTEDDPPRTPLGKALAAELPRFRWRRDAFEGVIAGVAMDLEQATYDDQDGLRLYCYRVASCVGFLCIPIFGDDGDDARAYAEHLGLALQYTNILRDVAEDALRGRVYLPGDLLARHDLTREDILAQRYDHRFVAMAQDFANLAEREYELAWKHLPRTDTRALLPAEIMGRTYHRILDEIRERNFNVFTRRASLRRRDKLAVAALAIARSGLGRT